MFGFRGRSRAGAGTRTAARPDTGTGAAFEIVLAGDTSLGDWYLQRAEREVLDRLHQRPESFFDGVAPLLSGSDLTIANLETVLCENPTSPLQGEKNYLGWDSPDRTTGVLRDLGVQAVSLANNHTMDFGPEVLATSTEQLDRAGIAYFGAGDSPAAAAAPFSHTIHLAGSEKNLYVVGALKNTAVLREYGFFVADGKWGTHPLSGRAVAEQISSIRLSDPESLIILFPHWGQNYEWATDLMWRTSARFVAAGADLVVGHGAHMLQELAYHDSGSVVFSLGNLVFNSRGRYRSAGVHPYSAVARLSLTRTGGQWCAGLRLYPIVSDNTTTSYTPRPVDEEEVVELFSTLHQRSADPERFLDTVGLYRDQRGWHIAWSAPLSPRLAAPTRPSGEAVAFPTSRPGKPAAALESGPPAHQRVPEQARPASPEPPQFPPGAERYGDGSTHQCLADALRERGIAYQEGHTVIRGTRRPALSFSINGNWYLISAARIYLADGDWSIGRRVDASAAGFVKRKDLVGSVLRASGISVPEGVVFGRSRRRDALRYFEALREVYPAGFCVKPVNGGLGRHVYTRLTTLDTFEQAFKAVTGDYDEVLVEQSLVGDVYRFLWVGGRISAVRVGRPMNVEGDGTHTIRELVEIKNRARLANPIHRYYPVLLEDAQRSFLDRQGRSPETVPAAGEIVFLAASSNLHAGADIIDTTDTVHPTYREEVRRAVAAIPGMLVCGADMMIEDQAVPAAPGNHAIIELNSGPGVGSHHFPWAGEPRDAAGDIVDLLRSLAPV